MHARLRIAVHRAERLEGEAAAERVRDDVDFDQSVRRRGVVEQLREARADVPRARDAAHVRERLREAPVRVARPVHRDEAIAGDGAIALHDEHLAQPRDESLIGLAAVLFVDVEAVDEEDDAPS